MAKRRLGPEHLEQINPRLVYCALKGFLPGPYEKRPALDEVVQMMGGLAYMTGPSGRPLRAGTSVVDIMGGMFGAFGTVLALKQRERTGKGGLVESALFESVVFLMGQHLAITAMNGAPPPPMARAGQLVGDLRDIQDRRRPADLHRHHVGRQWKRFCEFFKQMRSRPIRSSPPTTCASRRGPGWSRRWPRSSRATPRMRSRRSASRRHLLRAGRAAAGPVRSSAPAGQRLARADHAAGRGEDPAAAAAVPDVRLAPPLVRDPPEIGQHNVEVLAEIGYDDAGIAALKAAGMLGPK